MKEIQRNISKNEKLYQLLQKEFETFSIQFIIEGVGQIDENELKKALYITREFTPLVNARVIDNKWNDSGILPKIINLKDIEIDINEDIFRTKNNIEENATTTIFLFKNGIVFNIFHGIVDGIGATIWIENIFKALNNKKLVKANDFSNDDEFLDNIVNKKRNKSINLDIKIPINIKATESRFYNITLPYISKNIIYTLSEAVTQSLKSGKQRFVIPTDIRKYKKESVITSNLVRPILLEVEEDDNINSIREKFLNSLRKKEELFLLNKNLLSIITKNKKIGILIIKVIRNIQKKLKRNLGTGTISNLGKIELQNYSSKDFRATRVYSIPIIQPLAPISLNIIENDKSTEIVLGVYKGYLPNTTIENMISKIKNEICGEKVIIEKQDDVLHKIIENIEKNADKIAIYEKGKSYSYKELEIKICTIIKALKLRGYNPGDEVMVSLERGIDYIASILAVGILGGYFIPIDLNIPKISFEKILEISLNKILISDSRLKYEYENILNIENLEMCEENLKSFKSIENELFYTIYTSGSKGNPKGVKIFRKSVTNYLKWCKDYYKFKENDCFAFFTSIGVDLTITSYLLPLYNGGKIHIYSEETNAVMLKNLLNNRDVDFIKLTPTHLKIVSNLEIELQSKKNIIIGGEKLESSLIKKVFLKFKDKVSLYNEYGPTETTVAVSCHKIEKEDVKNNLIPIGLPIYNTEIRLIDGEIYIFGISLGKGYVNQKEVKENGYITLSNGRGYKTNDLGYINCKKQLVYQDRKGEEIKYLGHRLNIFEIKNNLIQNFKNIEDLYLKVHESILEMYIVIEDEDSIINILEYLKKENPELKIKRIFWNKQIFFLKNGKIDYTKFNFWKNLEEFESLEEVDTAKEYKELKSIIENILGKYNFKEELTFFELGGDSVDYITLQIEIIKTFNLSKNEEKFIAYMNEDYNNLTLENIIRCIEKSKNEMH